MRNPLDRVIALAGVTLLIGVAPALAHGGGCTATAVLPDPSGQHLPEYHRALDPSRVLLQRPGCL